MFIRLPGKQRSQRKKKEEEAEGDGEDTLQLMRVCVYSRTVTREHLYTEYRNAKRRLECCRCVYRSAVNKRLEVDHYLQQATAEQIRGGEKPCSIS